MNVYILLVMTIKQRGEIIMNKGQLRTILEEVMETGIADWRGYEGG